MEKDEPFIEVHQYVFKLSWNVAESRELSAEHRHAETGEANAMSAGCPSWTADRPRKPIDMSIDIVLLLCDVYQMDGQDCLFGAVKHRDNDAFA